MGEAEAVVLAGLASGDFEDEEGVGEAGEFLFER